MGLRTIIRKTIILECAHDLSGFVDPSHKCARLHGHTYRVTVSLSTEEITRGWVLDFGVIKDLIHGKFDHRYINEVFVSLGIKAPSTAEVLCDVFWTLLDEGPVRQANIDGEAYGEVKIEEITVQEGEGGVAILRRD